MNLHAVVAAQSVLSAHEEYLADGRGAGSVSSRETRNLTYRVNHLIAAHEEAYVAAVAGFPAAGWITRAVHAARVIVDRGC